MHSPAHTAAWQHSSGSTSRALAAAAVAAAAAAAATAGCQRSPPTRRRLRRARAPQVPPGVDSGSRLRVRSEGNAGKRGGDPGDLYVYITVKEHPELRREGISVHSDVEISYMDAILGTQVSRAGGGVLLCRATAPPARSARAARHTTPGLTRVAAAMPRRSR